MTYTSIKVQGPPEVSKSDHETHLQAQLQSIPKTTKELLITVHTPSDPEWAILGAHFSSVRILRLESHNREYKLNNKLIPLHWPLQQLTLYSTFGQLTQTPFVRKGLVGHLILFYDYYLRFKGLPNDKLSEEEQYTLRKGPKFPSAKFNKPNDKKLVDFTSFVADHMHRFLGETLNIEPENEPPAGPINLHTLEIWEYDSVDVFCRMAMALPHLVENLQTLLLRYTGMGKSEPLTMGCFRAFLPALTNLKTLDLKFADFGDMSTVEIMYKFFPPDLTTLFFRGPALLIESEHWADWLRAFESPDLLPQLQRLTFVLDIHYEYWCREVDIAAPEEILGRAREACEPPYEIARKRGITIESIPIDDDGQAGPMDDRW
ncbi:uncharacterized protein N7479_006953 [Penicillium vulpinum]|uniref:F-box domain-containing protein n=1 Tax=Penicillium vulpinum TaxID=29845 RepID=A0A1V6S2X9_9EURO|nr:uncharacterized protein N7479_006953 [Penicillium vulpinum]KAJ5959803.1 hypothetical protein N7479_006953 [Penicillium vulpinum]OQE08405.1 hypothetical protein PENVUL_c010G00250 [Penicillium vulpinum]